MEWPACLDEYQKLVNRMNNPRVVIDNAVCATATLVKVDSARKHRILLEAIQVLTDLNLSITKAYISSDGQWFMDVFHVTDQHGHKLTDTSLLSYIEQSLDSSSAPSKPTTFTKGLTVLELTGTDRPGLLSEVFAVLSDLDCGVVDAKVWTHNGRIASLISIKDESSGAAVEDPVKLQRVENRLRNVLRRDNDVRSAKTEVSSMDVTHVERRLHQMMFADRDYEQMPAAASESLQSVTVQNWVDRGYSIVNVQCLDRPKLLFDIVCTLTDMNYVVFHGTIDTDGDQARQEFYIRHADGSPISSEAERQRVIQCLQAAIERRSSQGVRLELYMMDRQRLLSDVTRTFRENGLSVARAEISTVGEMASNVFFVTDAAGDPVESKTIEAVRQRIGTGFLQVREPLLSACHKSTRAREEGGGGGGAGLFSIGSLVRRNLYNLGLIRSCS